MDPVRQMVRLIGTTLHTLGLRRSFDVLTVHPDNSVAIVIRVGSTGNVRLISRREIEARYALAQELPHGSLNASRLRLEQGDRCGAG